MIGGAIWLCFCVYGGMRVNKYNLLYFIKNQNKY